MGIKRIVDTDFWLDDKVVDMFSPEDKLFMLYLLTNPHTTQLGIYPLNRRVMAFELGYSLETVNVLLERFEVKYDIIKYSSKSSEIAVRNYLRHSIIKGGKPVEDLLLKEILNVKDRTLLRYVFDGLANYDNLNETVKKVMSVINDNDNDNDNENDVSSYDSYNDSSTNRPKRFSPPTLEEVTAYCQERKKGVDPNRWYDFYQSKGWMVGKNKMKDWKACVRTWEKSSGSAETDNTFSNAIKRIMEEDNGKS